MLTTLILPISFVGTRSPSCGSAPVGPSTRIVSVRAEGLYGLSSEVFAHDLLGVRIAGKRFEKVSPESTFSTAVGVEMCDRGRHRWRFRRVAGYGFRTRLGICTGEMALDANPVLAESGSSCWFYEDISGTVCTRQGKEEVKVLHSDLPKTTYIGTDTYVILDCDAHTIRFSGPSGDEGEVGRLPKEGSFKIFISADTVGDAWEVVKEDALATEDLNSSRPSRLKRLTDALLRWLQPR